VRSVLVMIAMLVAGAAAGAEAAEPGDRVVERVFSAVEKAVIEAYYRDRGAAAHAKGKKDKGLPPGLAKRDRLPPGLEMQLERRGRLPPGLEKRALPDDLARRLGPRRDGAVRHVVGRDVVLVDVATGVILDILRDIVRDSG
jgi:hypothetical protein